MALPLKFVTSTPGSDEPGTSLISQAIHAITIDLACSLPNGELVKLYRSIETALPHIPNRVIQFVSAYENEGAYTVAFEMAVTAARLINKRVLFIDTSGTQSRIPQNPTYSTPLETLLLTGRPPHEAIARAAGTDLYFAMLHKQGDDGFGTTSLYSLEKALENLRPAFDLIVIDSQAVLKDAFGVALAKLVDGSILVLEAERTRAPAAMESKRLIETSGGRMIGAILNKRRFYIPPFIYRLLYSHSAP